MHKPSFSLNTVDRSGDIQQNVNIRHGGVASLPPKEKSNPVVLPAVVASGKSQSASNLLRWKMMESVSPADTFSVAFAKRLYAYTQHIHERTRKSYLEYGFVLGLFFDDLPIGEIDNNKIRAYQNWRNRRGADDPYELAKLKKSKFRHAAGNVRIRNEINGALKPVLKEIGTWYKIKKRGFKHLPVPKGEGAGVALTKEEQAKLLEVAFSNIDWRLAAHSLLIMYRTGSGFGELCKLRRRDVDLQKRTMSIIEGAKVDPRVRVVAFIPSVHESMQWLVSRWQRMGGTSLDEYLLPHRTKGFTHPMTSIYGAWRPIKKALMRDSELDRQCPGMREKLKKLRVYDGRVSAASLLLGDERLSLPTIEKALGWSPNSDMRKRYHRKEVEDNRAALMTLESVGGVA